MQLECTTEHFDPFSGIISNSLRCLCVEVALLSIGGPTEIWWDLHRHGPPFQTPLGATTFSKRGAFGLQNHWKIPGFPPGGFDEMGGDLWRWPFVTQKVCGANIGNHIFSADKGRNAGLQRDGFAIVSGSWCKTVRPCYTGKRVVQFWCLSVPKTVPKIAARFGLFRFCREGDY